VHDVHRQRRRLVELRNGTGRPPTRAELTKLFRANAKSLWLRAPWFPALTIWLSPALEARFTEDCCRAGLPPERTAPVIMNTLRWAWRRSVLNYRDDDGWQRSLAAARKRQARIGPPREDYVYAPPEGTPPTDPRIKVILRRMHLAQGTSPVGRDRTTKSKARKAHGHRFRAPASFDWRGFLAEHWLSTFRSLFAAHHIDTAEVDGELGRRLAVAWHAVLDEREQLDGAAGAAFRSWMALLRQIKQDQDQGTNHYLRRS
jgi:hypothetical protein